MTQADPNLDISALLFPGQSITETLYSVLMQNYVLENADKLSLSPSGAMSIFPLIFVIVLIVYLRPGQDH